MFDGIYKKLERELAEKKKEMSAIIEDSKNAYQARDKAQNEVAMLRAAVDKEKAEFEREWRELSGVLEQERALKEGWRRGLLGRPAAAGPRPGAAARGAAKASAPAPLETRAGHRTRSAARRPSTTRRSRKSRRQRASQAGPSSLRSSTTSTRLTSRCSTS